VSCLGSEWFPYLTDHSTGIAAFSLKKKKFVAKHDDYTCNPNTQEDPELEASLGFMVIPCPKKKKNASQQ
jgi:hypothetical protein